MSSIGIRQELGEYLLTRVLRLEPALASDLTRIILNVDDEELLAIVCDEELLQTLVQMFSEGFQRGSLSREAYVVDSDDELVPLTPSGSDKESGPLTPLSFSSDEESESPALEPATQGAVMVAEPEDTRDRRGAGDSNTSASSWGKTQYLDPEVMYDAPRQTAESTRDPANLDHKMETLFPESPRGHHESKKFVETTRGAARLNTMKESVASSSTLPKKEAARAETAQSYEFCTSLESTSTASDILGPDRAAAAPAGPASQKKDGKRVPKTAHRGTRGGAANHNAAAVEAEAPASMPLMEAVRPAEPARGDQQSARRAQPLSQGTRQPANTGTQLDELDLDVSCAVGFCCGVGLATCLIILITF